MKENNASLKRNSFQTYYFKDEMLAGKYNFPTLDKIEIQSIHKLKPFNIFKSSTNKDCWVHFFIDDYQFERIWKSPTQYINLLKQSLGIISTDFSMYRDMPKAIQIYNCYRNRALARFYQKQGIKVIPSISWSDEESFEWCFDGIPENSAVAISSNGCLQNPTNKRIFIKGFNKMIEILKPSQIIVIGKVPNEIQNEKITRFNSFGENLLLKCKEE